MVSGEEVGSAFVSIGVQIDESTMSAAKSKFSSAVSDMSSGVGGLKSSLGSELSASMSGIASSMGPVGGALSAIGPAGMVAGAGIAVVGSALSSSVTTAAGFQQQMAGVAAIMGSSGAELQAMSTAAREAGASTQFSASQAAEALSYMAGAGWDSQQATAGLKDTLTMAAAGGMDLASAGDMMTNTISQFNLAATDSGRVSNVLAAGAAETNTNITQLGGGLKEVGSTASAFGMSLESTTAALGALSDAGIKGAEGGTALRGILAGLASQSGPAAEALAELGISAEQINPATVGVADAMELLNEKGMTATQALKIFGRENVSAATYLAAHASSLDDLETSITGTSKATEMAATMTDTYEGAMGELSSAVEEAQIALGTVLLPVVTDVVEGFTVAVTATTEFGKAIYDVGSGISSAFSEAWEGGSLADIDEAFLSALGVDTGKEAGDQLAEGVAESDDLKAAPGKALGSPEALAGAGDAGKDLAKSVSEEMISGIQAGMDDLDIMAMINSQESDYNDTFDRLFDYAGKSLRMHLSEGASGNFWSLFSGDTLLGKSFGGDAASAFQAITGLPAPKEGTEAYFRLMGDSAKAEIIKLQEALQSGAKINIADVIFGPEDAIKSKAEELGSSAASALADGIVTQTERMEYLGLAQDLDTLKREFPAEFAALGEESGQALMDALKREDFAGALAILAKDAGDAAGDAINKSLQSKLQEGSGMFYGDFLTQEHDWTEYVNPESGYVGPTQYYDDYIAQKQGQISGALAAMQNVEDIQVGLKVDTTQGERDISSFKSATEKENIDKPLKIDKTKASEDIALVDKSITAAMIKPISLSGVEAAMSQIAAIDAAASKPVIKPIYLQMGYGSASGAGGYGGNTWGDWMPSFANEGFVRSPTLAVIGDRPGGEYVVGAARFEAAVSKIRSGGAPQITIHYNPVINGSGLSSDELSRVLEDHDEKLIDQIVEQSKKAVAYDMARGKKW